MDAKGVRLIDAIQLAHLMKRTPAVAAAANASKLAEKILPVDLRRFADYNTNHIRNAVNLCCSNLMQRRILSKKLSILDLLSPHMSPKRRDKGRYDVVLYSYATTTAKFVDASASDCAFLRYLTEELAKSDQFRCVFVLKGGFADFQSRFPDLCENTINSVSTVNILPADKPKDSTDECLRLSFRGTSANRGPSNIIPQVFLGSVHDALNERHLKDNNITHVINLSATCPKSCLIDETNFLRIPVMDSNNERIISHFEKAFHFLDKALKAGANVLVHCLAGVSRSPTFVIAYLMRERGLTVEEAYRFVKERRPCIAPNFNFLGQLMQYEKQLLEAAQKRKLASGSRRYCSTFHASAPLLVDPDQEYRVKSASLKSGCDLPDDRDGLVVVCGRQTNTSPAAMLRKKQSHDHHGSNQTDRLNNKHRSSLVVSIGAACLPVVRGSAKCIFRRISPIKSVTPKSPVVAFVRQSSIS